MGRNTADQMKKDGTPGYMGRAFAAPAAFVTGVVESVSHGALEVPIANRMLGGAAKAGQTVDLAYFFKCIAFLVVVSFGADECFAQAAPKNFRAWPEWGGAFVRDVTVVSSWNAVSGASSYDVEYTPYSGAWVGRPFLRSTKALGHRLGPMAPAGIPNSGYRVRVRAVSSSGTKGTFTKPTTVSVN